jgi:hypothetical protein
VALAVRGVIPLAAAGTAALVLIVAGAGRGAAGGLVAAYAFDETVGTTTPDHSGNGNTGTISGATRSTAGRFGGALSFDGTNDAVVVADSSSLDLTTGLTIEAWVRPTALGTKWRTVVAKEQSGRLTYGLYANRNTSRPWAEIYAGGSVRGAAGTSLLPVNTWTHLASTYDGATLRLYVNGAQAASTAFSGAISVSTGSLRIGGNSIWGEWFAGLVDEIRIYDRALPADEIQRDMATSITTPDLGPPTPPSGFGVTAAGRTSLATSWSASSDDVAVAGYRLFLDGAPAGTAAATAFTFSQLGCSTEHVLAVEAFDAAGNVSTRAATTGSTQPCDTSPPQVSLTAPPGGATVSGTFEVSGTALDDDQVAGVRFTLDGNSLGTEDTQPPYAVQWNTRASPNGSHVLGATARDPSGNVGTAPPVPVTVDNGQAPPAGLVAGYAFEESSGASVLDVSGRANVGTLSGPTRTTAGRFRNALSFDGVNDRVDVPDSQSLDVTAGVTVEGWVFPTALGTVWRTVAGKERSGGIVYVLYANRSTRVPSAQVYAGGKVRTANGTAQLPLNTWTHLAMTYDGTLRLYVNGSLAASAAGGGAIGTSSGPFRIGGNAIWNEWLAGRIDEVRVYDRALSEAEIRADMEIPVATAPTPPQLTLAEDDDDEHVVDRTLFYRPLPGAGGSFRVAATSSDPSSGIARIVFPAVFGSDGGDDVASPFEAEYVWAAPASVSGPQTVTAVNGWGITSDATFTITPDTTAPANGSIGYADGYDADGSIAVAGAHGTDAQSGVNPSSARLERETATLAAGDCGAFGSFEPVSSPDSPGTGRCARYRLRVSDNVGNEAVYESGGVVKVDLTRPAGPTLNLAEAGPGGHVHGSTLYYRPGSTGALTVSAGTDDAESGIAAVRFPDVFAADAAVDSTPPYEASYVWTEGMSGPRGGAITAENGAGGVSSTPFAVEPDGVPPEGGSVTYPDGEVPAGPVTVAVDPGFDDDSGLDPASAALERQSAGLAGAACGPFGAWEPAASPDELAAGTCARYRFHVADQVGNTALYASPSVVRAPAAETPPPPPATAVASVTENEPDEHVVGTTLYYNGRRGNAGVFTVSAQPIEPGFTPVQAVFPDVFGADGAVDTQAPFEHTYAWNHDSIAAGPFSIVLEDAGGGTATGAFAVFEDDDEPDSVWAAYSGGYEAGPILVETDIGFDLGAGLAPGSERLERDAAPFAAGACAPFASQWADVVLVGGVDPTVLPDTCYRYRLRVSDLVGNLTTFMPKDVVKIDVAPPGPPSALEVMSVTETTATVHWAAAADNGRVGGYALSRSGRVVANTWTTSHTVRNLACGTTTPVEVRAMDLARQFSEPAVVDVTTQPCTGSPPPADVYVSPAGSDAASCTAAAPCLTLERAYRAAQPGQVVELADGLYAGQSVIPVDPAKTSEQDVLVRPAPGAVAELESLDVFGGHVSFQDLLVAHDLYVKCGADDVTFRHGRAAVFFISSASDVSLLDSEFGPAVNVHSRIQRDAEDGCANTSSNVLLDGLYLHDNYTFPHDSEHMECLTIQTVDGLTLRNSRFHRCEDFDVLVKRLGAAADTRNVLIENSWFDEPYPDGVTSIQFSVPASGGSFTNVTLRHNSFASRPILKPLGVYTDFRVIANVGTDFTCFASVTYARNVWQDGPACGATDTVAAMAYVDQQAFDLHLQPGAAAVGHGDPADHPATDIDGDPRQDGLPDAGADEIP